MKSKTTNKWVEYYRSIGLPEDLSGDYSRYIKNLQKNNVPIILSYSHLCMLVGWKSEALAKVINGTSSFYRSFSIPKRSGGLREIACPHRSLLEIQHWIKENILDRQAVHYSAHGFIKNKSIISNARVHCSSSEILKIDLKDFFPSINLNRVIGVFRRMGYSKNVSFYLGALCTLDGKLVQGAPTSPVLSNIICVPMDYRIRKLTEKLGYKYTRYADDMTISGEKIGGALYAYLAKIIEDCGFEIKQSKTRFLKTKNAKTITGVRVQDGRMFIPNEMKRRIRHEMHFIFKYGLDSHLSKVKNKDPKYLQKLLGKLSFWLQVEPMNEYATESKLKIVKEMKVYAS